MDERIAALEEAVSFAIDIIESYQMDLRNSDDFVALAVRCSASLADIGFCQGVIYLNALPKLRAILHPETTH